MERNSLPDGQSVYYKVNEDERGCGKLTAELEGKVLGWILKDIDIVNLVRDSVFGGRVWHTCCWPCWEV